MRRKLEIDELVIVGDIARDRAGEEFFIDATHLEMFSLLNNGRPLIIKDGYSDVWRDEKKS